MRLNIMQSVQSIQRSTISLHGPFRSHVNITTCPNRTSSEKYRTALEDLPNHPHGRNNELVRIALFGLNAGVAPDQIAEDLQNAGGEPMLSRDETVRAVGAAQRRIGDRSAPARKPVPSPPTEGERSFVPRMLEAGRGFTVESLRNASPVPLLDTQHDQALAFLTAIALPQDGYIFSGSKYDARTRERLLTPRELIERLKTGIPEYIIPNAFTGKPGQVYGRDGTPHDSYACNTVLQSRRFAVLEFDAMPLPEQVEFFAGIIRTGSLPLRSLVYSGGKSIHGLVELTERRTPEGPDRGHWDEQWRQLARLCCSHEDNLFHADIACRDATRLTRMAGAVRTDNNKRQTLLWLHK